MAEDGPKRRRGNPNFFLPDFAGRSPVWPVKKEKATPEVFQKPIVQVGPSSRAVIIPSEIVNMLELEYGDKMEMKVRDGIVWMRKTGIKAKPFTQGFHPARGRGRPGNEEKTQQYKRDGSGAIRSGPKNHPFSAEVHYADQEPDANMPAWPDEKEIEGQKATEIQWPMTKVDLPDLGVADLSMLDQDYKPKQPGEENLPDIDQLKNMAASLMDIEDDEDPK